MPTTGNPGRVRRPATRYACGLLLAGMTLGGCSSSPVSLTPRSPSSPTTVPASSGPSASPAPTVAPTHTPTPSPTGTAPGVALCNAPAAQLGVNYYELTLIGDVPAGGGAFTLATGAWIEENFTMGTPPPTPMPTSTPTVGPTPTPPPTRPIYIYSGTYAVTSTIAPTTGCFRLITTTDGSNLTFVAHSAVGDGIVNPPSVPHFNVNLVATGAISAASLSVSPQTGTGSGTFTLDNNDTGTISVTSVQTVQLPFARVRRPSAASSRL